MEEDTNANEIADTDETINRIRSHLVLYDGVKPKIEFKDFNKHKNFICSSMRGILLSKVWYTDAPLVISRAAPLYIILYSS